MKYAYYVQIFDRGMRNTKDWYPTYKKAKYAAKEQQQFDKGFGWPYCVLDLVARTRKEDGGFTVDDGVLIEIGPGPEAER